MGDAPPRDHETPRIGVDVGREGLVLAHNRLTISGWAAAPGGIASMAVRIGGREMMPSLGLPPDRGGEEGREPPVDRFELALDCSAWSRGIYEFEVIARGKHGSMARVRAAADVQPFVAPVYGDDEVAAALAAGRPLIWCEQPTFFAGPEGEAPLEVSGWAVAGSGIDAVMVTIDGALRVPCPHGLRRPDAIQRLGPRVGAEGGFAVRLDPSECMPGWRHLTVVAVAGDGAAVGIEGMVECKPARRIEDGGGENEDRPMPRPRGRSLPAGWTPERRARYRWAAGVASGARVLDVGCGDGYGTAELATPGGEAIGIDVSPPLVAAARESHGNRAGFRVADMRRLPFDEASFDLVVCFEALEEVGEPAVALDEMHRVLAPTGSLIVSAANPAVYPDGNPLHRARIGPAELRSLLEARFANVEVHRQVPYFASLLGDDEMLLHDDAGVPLGASVAKLTGSARGSELHAVAAASDGPLPAPPSVVALGEVLDARQLRRRGEWWNDEAVAAEAEAADARVRLRAARDGARRARARFRQAERAVGERPQLDREAAALESALADERRRYAALAGSRSWRLTEPLRRLAQLARSKDHLR